MDNKYNIQFNLMLHSMPLKKIQNKDQILVKVNFL